MHESVVYALVLATSIVLLTGLEESHEMNSSSNLLSWKVSHAISCLFVESAPLNLCFKGMCCHLLNRFFTCRQESAFNQIMST
jgi:hypothetical protein